MSKGHTRRNRDKRREQMQEDRKRAYKWAHNIFVRNMDEREQRRARTRRDEGEITWRHWGGPGTGYLSKGA